MSEKPPGRPPRPRRQRIEITPVAPPKDEEFEPTDEGTRDIRRPDSDDEKIDVDTQTEQKPKEPISEHLRRSRPQTIGVEFTTDEHPPVDEFKTDELLPIEEMPEVPSQGTGEYRALRESEPDKIVQEMPNNGRRDGGLLTEELLVKDINLQEPDDVDSDIQGRDGEDIQTDVPTKNIRKVIDDKE